MGDGIRLGKVTEEMLGHLTYWLAKRCPQLPNSLCDKLLEVEYPNRKSHHWFTLQPFAVYRGDAERSPEQLGVRTDKRAQEVLKRIDNKVPVLMVLLGKLPPAAARQFREAIQKIDGVQTGSDGRHTGRKESRVATMGSSLRSLAPGDADEQTEAYRIQAGDLRPLLYRQIRERRGQQQFRNSLRSRYGDRCLITGCEVLDVLEAAHIKPYRREEDNNPENGLLLRADIHTLFDLNLIGIDPNRLSILVHPVLNDDATYSVLVGKSLQCGRKRRPSLESLKLRYEQYAAQLTERD